MPKSQASFFLSFSLSLISLSPITISSFSVPSFHSPHFMITISYLHSSRGLHFYIVFLVEEHTKADIFISKLYECKFVFFVTSNNTKRRSKSRLQLQFLSENSTKKVEEETNLQKASIFISNKFVFFDSLTTFCLFLCFSQYNSLNFFVNLSLLRCPIFFGFYDFSQDKSFNFFGYSPFILFSEFSHYKKFKFFCVPEPSTACLHFGFIPGSLVVAMARILDRKSTDSSDRVANNQEATKLE
ncbi:hypothetical protein HKD37_10G028590 [Glycine soja]